MAFAATEPSAQISQPDSPLPFDDDFDAALRQAQELRERGELEPASRVLAQLVIAAPNDAQVIGEYGKVMLESGRTGDAVAFLERAAGLQPYDWTLFSALGSAYDQQGDHQSALAAFEHALALKPGEPNVVSNLALSRIRAGELDEAERLLVEASQDGKDFPGLADTLAMVRHIRATTVPSLAAPADVAAPEGATPRLTPFPVETAPAQSGVPALVKAPSNTSPVSTQAPARRTPPAANSVAATERPPPGPATTRPANAAQTASAFAKTLPAQRETALDLQSARTAPPAVEPKPADRIVSPIARSTPAIPTRTAGTALAVTPSPESWESMVRVALPEPYAELHPAPPARPAAPVQRRPEGWFDVLKRWTFAVLGFLSRLWA
jgi:tetratricopeptide (TPR) repeat protein